MLSGAVRPGRSPIRTAAQSAPSNAAMVSPMATRPCRTTTSGATRTALLAQRRQQFGQQRPRMRLHRARRQSVADDEDDVVFCRHPPPMPRRPRREAAAEVRTHQISLPVVGCARRPRAPERPRLVKIGHQPRLVERLVHRVAGAGMRELELQQRRGRQRGAAACQPDARRRQPPQARPRCRSALSAMRRQAVSSARNGFGSSRGRTRLAASIRPCRASQASNSGAGRWPSRSRMASASWNEVL